MNSLLFTFLFLFALYSFNSVFSDSTPSSYEVHCASVVSKSVPVKLKPSSFPLPQLHTGYFTGGDRILGAASSWHQNTFSLQTNKVYQTKASGLFKIEATLSFISRNYYYYGETYSYGSHSRRSRGKVVIKLDGFWSESSGSLCMIGKGNAYSQDGDLLHVDAVFKLSNVLDSSKVTSLIHGSLESLSSVDDPKRYFEPIYVLMLPKKNYEYSLDSAEVEHDFASHGDDAEDGLALDSSLLCSTQVSSAIRRLNLEYPRDCYLNSAKNCDTIIGVNVSSARTSVVSLNKLECSSHKEKPRLRVLVGFPYDNYYYGSYDAVNGNQQTTPMFVGEGWWDETQNELRIVACHFMGVQDSSSPSSLASAHVGDCSIRLRLKFRSVLSIRNTSTIVGQIWSSKNVKDSLNFNDGFGGSKVAFQGLKYEYTQLERAKKSCPSRQNQVKNQEKSYPDAYSSNMRIDMSVKESKKRIGWGYSSPLSVDDQIYRDPYWSFDSDTTTSAFMPFENPGNTTLFNVSYEITMSLYSTSMLADKTSLFNKSSNSVRISAEGTYDAETGSLCMVGCRNLVSNYSGNPKTEDSQDCEVLIKFQFPPLDSGRSYTKGSIESTRKSSDPLYFKVLNLTASSYYTQGADTAWRMDMETIMVLVFTTLACAFVVAQLNHVKRHPNVLPFISLTMVSILTLGHMVPLVLNFEALFTQNRNNRNFMLRNFGWFHLEGNETIVRLFTMVVFLLLFRLLQITWSARKVDEESQKSLWVAEKKTACVILPLYALGFLIALILKPTNNYGVSSYQRQTSWEGLKHYGGLVLDGFLLPQIMFNMFSNLKENALCRLFYFGTSFVRMVPHAYDLYRAHNYVEDDDGSYYYADPSADYYSTAWDIVIPLGSLLLAVIILMQQRFGGSCVLPRRFRRSQEGYQKVPMATIPEEEEKEKEEKEAEASNV